ncbi:uncharacterized protein LOC130698113 [Daphnia carinata]|uniref:uncharacterized protein LOC130698113 n=1 Tax=Daphnia carinata TaxID=120202 RepID=UPI00257B9DB7|nr:uncharacterized protein LOC130698113 [Daphnia carinata]
MQQSKLNSYYANLIAGYFRPSGSEGQCRFCSNADRLSQRQAHRFLPLLQSRQDTVPGQQGVEGRPGTCASSVRCIHLTMPEGIEKNEGAIETNPEPLDENERCR